MAIKGAYGVRWCDGAQENIRSVRSAMKLARAKSGKRFATPTCGPGSYVVRYGAGNQAQTVAECSEKACTPFRTRKAYESPFTPAMATKFFKQQRDLGALPDWWPFGKKPAPRNPMTRTVYMMKTPSGKYVSVRSKPVTAMAGARRRRKRRRR
jgi:hypothetical protein